MWWKRESGRATLRREDQTLVRIEDLWVGDEEGDGMFLVLGEGGGIILPVVKIDTVAVLVLAAWSWAWRVCKSCFR